MGCCGHYKGGLPGKNATHKTRPEEPCVSCAEKHVATAWTFATERGYEHANRIYVIGELVAAEKHLADASVRERVRAIRHLIQQRREAEVDWTPMLAEIDALAGQEATKILEEQTNKKEA